MKNIPAALETHLGGDAWTLATLWTITRQDATVFRFTDHDQDIVSSGDTYKAAIGYVTTAIKHGIDTSVDNMDVNGLLDDAGITAAELAGGFFDNAAVTIELVNWAAPTNGTVPLLEGNLGAVSAQGDEFSAELRALAQKLAIHIGRLITPSCDADLGDARCGVTLASYSETGAVTNKYRIDAVRWNFVLWTGIPTQAVYIWEAQVRASIGGADQCTPAANASASFEFQPATQAFDDNTSTAWVGATSGTPWLRFDFDNPVWFAEYWFHYKVSQHPMRWTVEVLLEGETQWLEVDNILSADWGTPAGDQSWAVAQTAGASTGSKISFYDDARSEAVDYWVGGKLTWTSGANAGLERDIKASAASGLITFWEPLPFDIAIGDAYSIQPGCDKTTDTCKNTYSNLVNFRGFPHLRGITELLRGPQ